MVVLHAHKKGNDEDKRYNPTLSSTLEDLPHAWHFNRRRNNMVLSFPNEEFIKLGLLMASNWSNEMIAGSKLAISLERMRDFYFVSPQTMYDLFRDIQNHELGDDCIRKPIPQEFLASLYFFKKYPTKISHGAFLGKGEKSSLLKAWKYIRAFQALKASKIKWMFDERGEGCCEESFIVTVDGVHCRISEPRTMPSSGWFACKHNKARLAYEVAVAIFHDQICWINGPFPAGQNDLRIFRKALKDKIPVGKKAIADEGFVGEPQKAATRNVFDTPEVKDFKRRAKARQETVNAKLKSFGILSQVFRTTGEQRLEKHKAAFEACCVMIQYELDNHSRKLMKV